MAAANKTIDHRVIRRWVEEHGGQPATVKRTRGKSDVGMIRVDFPGFSGEGSLEPISWSEWFQKFDEQQLAFLYQDGKDTNFNKLVRRDGQVRASDRRRGTSRTTRGGRAAARALGAERQSASSRRGARSNGQSARTQRSQPRSAGGSARGSARRGASRSMQDMTKAELYGLARSAGVPHRSTMNKSELLRALEQQRR